MFFLNLTAGEFLALLGALSGLVAALYLLDRSRRKKIVSTLRFWTPALAAEERQSRKRMREPWSLVLQLVSLLLLLLAIAQLQWGSRERSGRDHVLLLDTSSWATALSGPQATVLAQENAAAREYLSALPARDRVMVVRAGALSAPVTPFTRNRQQLLNALSDSVAGFSALNIGQALSFARQAQNWSGGRQGEIVYIGPKRIGQPELSPPGLPNLRIISILASRQNSGIRRIGVKRNEDDPNSWQATVTLKNYGSNRRNVRLLTGFAGTAFAARTISLAPAQETSAEYNFDTNTAGRLTVRIEPGDGLAADDSASIELPKSGLLNVAVFTNRPEVLRPLLEANHRLAVKIFAPSQYLPAPAADVVLLDQFSPPRLPVRPSLWIEPPKTGSPLPVRAIVNNALVKSWQSDTPLSTGLHAKETRLPNTEVFQTFEGDVTVGSIAEGPIVVARAPGEGQPKLAVIGFDPLNPPLRFEVTTPLLFANLLRWLAPQSFRTLDISAGTVGPATVTLDKNEQPGRIHVAGENGFTVPFTVRSGTLQLFAARPNIVHVHSGDGERILSLTLPDVAEFEWTPPADAATGLPARAGYVPGPLDLWAWLACLGGLGLFVEWMLFGRNRVITWRKPAVPQPRLRTLQDERELVSK